MKGNPGKIGFGAICSGTQLFSWQFAVIQKLMAASDIDFKLLIFIEDRPKDLCVNSAINESKKESGILWNLYFRFVIAKRSKALRIKTIDPGFDEIHQIHCTVIKGPRGTPALADADIWQIRDTGLDFILNFSLTGLSGTVLHAAKYGIWSFHFGDPKENAGIAHGFWEIYHQNVLTRACLYKLSGEPGHMCLLKDGILKTTISLAKNIDGIHFEASNWPLQVCMDIRNNRLDNQMTSLSIKPAQILHLPGNFDTVLFFLVQLKLLIKKIYKSIFFTDYWNIGVAYAPIQDFLDPNKSPVVEWYKRLPKSHFIADPFGLYLNETLHILCEDFRFNEGIGKTASLLFQNGQFTQKNIVIDEKFHMSYPGMVVLGNEVFCIPETYQANQVRLYKAVEFPDKWKLEKVLIEDYAGIDNTLFEFENVWYLFSTDKNSGPHFNLNIHFSDNIYGPWKEHPKNPVKTDIRSARPAGTFFERDGAIYRPSMDYSEKVEGRIIINKIVTLSPVDFKEKAHTIVNPFRNTYFSDKVHTLSQAGPYTLVDGAKELFVLGNADALVFKIKGLLKKMKR